MMKRFIKNYLWFWKESFKFMEGHNKFYTAFKCFSKAIPFCVFMEKSRKLDYRLMDRVVEFK